MAGATAQLNMPLLAAKDKMFGALSADVSMSLWRTRHAQTGTTMIRLPGGVPDVQIPTLSIVHDPVYGVPSRLY